VQIKKTPVKTGVFIEFFLVNGITFAHILRQYSLI